MLYRICLVLVLVTVTKCAGLQSRIHTGKSFFRATQQLHRTTNPCVQIQKKKISPRLFSSKNDDGWEAGDVYRDLDALEYAINLANAEENLQQAERLETLDYCAKQRREIYPDLNRFVCFPLALSLLVRIASRNRTLKIATQAMTRCSDLHFWLVVVTAPLLLLLAKMITKPKPEPMPEEMKHLDPKYFPFITIDWVEPEKNCQDSVQFLLEYWASAVLGVAMMGTGVWLNLIPSTATVRFWMSFIQPITRLGAIASIHQFQSQIFKILRSQQPKPIGFFPSAMRFLVTSTGAMAPLAVSFELARAFLHLRRDGFLALYTSIIALVIGTVVRMDRKGRDGFQKLEKRSAWTKVLHTFAAVGFWKKPLDNLRQNNRLIRSSFSKYAPKRLNHWVTLCAKSSVGILALIGPWIHLQLLFDQFRIVYTHDLSLSVSSQMFKKQIGNETEMVKRMRWRHRIEWRDEQRLKPLLKDWISNFDYWLLVKGTVREKLENERIEALKARLKKGNMVWEKVQSDGLPMTNRQRWKTNAMDRIAKKHQEDYDKKTFEDPLGVAVQQTLGIGLGFNFDHMRPLEPDEKPSVRRLQARAAKSAIRRVQEIYDVQSAREKLDRIEDPDERNRMARAVREETEIEVKYLANRLTKLVPNTYSSEFDDGLLEVQQLRDTRSYKRTSSHEFTIDSLEDTAAASKGVKIPSFDSRVDELDKSSSNRDLIKEFDDDFLESYLEHLQNKDSDDSDESMVLA